MIEKRRSACGSRLSAIMGILILALALTACGGGLSQGETVVEKQAFYLNTVCNIRLQEWEGSQEDAEALIDEAYALCLELENQLSRTIPGSEIDRINQAGGQMVEITDPRVVEALEKGVYYGGLSDGRFDITVGNLVGMWNFSSGDNVVPPKDAIAAELPHIGYENLIIESANHSSEAAENGPWLVTLNDPQAHIDLGAIAKGYIVDQVSDFLRERGVTRGVVDFGGNISCIGTKEDGSPWNIGIRKPVDETDGEAGENQLIGLVHVPADRSAVTSGTYERKFVQDGVLYHHILDPETGYPCDTDVSGVTVIGSRSTDCDALSTICLLLGEEEGMELIESLEDTEAVFITRDGEIHCSSGVEFQAME